MNAWAIVPDHLVLALGWTLLHFLWQGALVAGLLAVAGRAFDRNASAPRYALAAGALLLMAALPAATFVKLAGDFAAGPAATAFADRSGAAEHVAVATTAAKRSIADPAGAPAPGMSAAGPAASPLAWNGNAPRADASPWLAARVTALTGLRMLGAALAGAFERGAPLWMPWLVALWGMGVSLLTLRLIGGWVTAQRIKRTVIDGPVDRLQSALERLGARMGVSRPVRVFRSALVDVPTVIGWLRPVVLVPVGAVAGLPPAQLEALLAHELAHIRRHDYLVNLLQTVAETLLFYHPAVWWVSRQVREERENCCDDLAVEACGDRVGYARALCELERLRLQAPSLAMAASGGSLLHRIRRLLQPAPRVSLVSRCGACLVVIGSLMFVVLGLAPAAIDERERGGGTFAALAAIAHAPEAPAAPAAPPMIERMPAPPAPSPWPSGRAQRAPAVPPVPPVPEVGPAPQPGEAAPAPVPPRAPAPPPAPAAPHGGTLVHPSPPAAAPAPWPTPAHRPAPAATWSAAHVASAVIEPGAGAIGYREAMRHAGDLDADEELFEAMMRQGLDATYVRGMTAVFGETPDGEELLGMYVTGVTPDYARAMREILGPDLDTDDLLGLRVHRIGPDYAKDIAARVGHLDADELVAMKLQNVTPRQLDALRKIGVDPGEEGLVELRTHGISLGYVAQMRHFRGHDLTLDQLIALHESGISPEAAGAMNLLGYHALSVDDLVTLAQHGLTVEQIAQLTSAFGRTLTVDELLALQNNGVNVVYAGNMAHLHVAEFGVGDIVTFHQHGVPSAWIAAVLETGYPHLDVEDLLTLADRGVESRYLRGLKEAGYGSLDPDEVVRLFDAGISTECIGKLGRRLSAGELIERCERGGDCTKKR